MLCLSASKSDGYVPLHAGRMQKALCSSKWDLRGQIGMKISSIRQKLGQELATIRVQAELRRLVFVWWLMGTSDSLFGERAGGWVPDGLVVLAGGYKIHLAKAGPYAVAVIKYCQSSQKAYKQVCKRSTLEW